MYKVILIDDEPWALYALEHSIDWEKKGFQVIGTASNGEEGFEIINKEKPDVVFTDICMDDCSGIDLLKKVRDHNILSEFIVVSAYEEFSYAQKAIYYGVFDYVLKPIEEVDGNKLLDRLSKHLADKMELKKEAEEEFLSENRQGYINPNFELLLDYVDTHFREDLTLSFLAEKFYLNISYICVLFKKLKKDTFSGYLNSVRMKEARKLLLTTTETTAVIAEMVGYKDYYYFNKVFKKQFGMTPRQCRIKGGANEKENEI